MTKYAFLLSLASLLFSFPLFAQDEHQHTEPLARSAELLRHPAITEVREITRNALITFRVHGNPNGDIFP